MELKRVVVTGLGALTPIGNNVEAYWEGLKNGTSGSAPITYFDPEKFKTKFACEIKNYDPNDHFHRKESRKLDRFAQYALISSDSEVFPTELAPMYFEGILILIFMSTFFLGDECSTASLRVSSTILFFQ